MQAALMQYSCVLFKLEGFERRVRRCTHKRPSMRIQPSPTASKKVFSSSDQTEQRVELLGKEEHDRELVIYIYRWGQLILPELPVQNLVCCG